MQIKTAFGKIGKSKMEIFTTSRNLNADNENAIAFLTSVLTANGFSAEYLGESRAVFISPGMNSTKQNPVLGASRIEAEVFAKQLKLTAELGGVTRMSKFITWFPLILCFSLAIIFFVIGLIVGPKFVNAFNLNNQFGLNWVWMVFGICLMPALPWILIAPMMRVWVKNRTQKALETLANNAVNVPELAN